MKRAISNSRGSFEFSFYKGGIKVVVPTDTLNLGQTHKIVCHNRWLQRLTEELRALPQGSEAWQMKKSQLPNITPAGVFTRRANDALEERSGLLVLDFDHVPNLAKLKKALRRDPVFGGSLAKHFVSPSGDGLKVIVVVDCEVAHATSFEAIKAYLQAQQPHWFQYLDKATGDVARACFLAHDPKAFLHHNWEYLPPFPVDAAAGMAAVPTTPSAPLDSGSAAEDAATAERWVQAVEAADGFPDDYKSWYKTAAALATTCGEELGRELYHRVSKPSPKYNPAKTDKQFDEMLKRNYTQIKLGTFIHYCQQASIMPAAILPDPVAMPLFEAGIYPLLPDYLRRCCAPFEGIERDVMLLGTLAVLSGCFPGVGGVYNRRTCSLNLFVFIAGPAASGKGALAWARHLVEPWDEQLLDASIRYYEQLTAYEKAADPSLPPPVAPPYHQLLVPGNITAAALIACLATNRGRGVICETEADTLSGQLGSDFGNFSDILRKAFHGEPVTVMRKTNREHLRVKRPALSVALTGTADQLLRLLPSAEDGLVSRILFKIIDPDYEWKDVGPGSGSPLDPYMDKLASELSSMLSTMPTPPTAGEYATQITLAATDWQRLNEACKEGLDEALAAHGGQGASTAYRLGLIVWRIVGILTVLRCFERGITPGEVVEAEAVDVTTALSLMQTARTHAMAVLGNLAKPTKLTTNPHDSKAEKVAEATALRASGLSWRKIEQKVGVPFNTIRRWLKAID